MLDRLVGLETEYALRFAPHDPDGERVPNAALFDRLFGHVRAKVPVAPAIVSEMGWFLASGGSVKLERTPFLVNVPTAGMVEGSTPECRGPRQFLLHQRAQDVLLSKAAAASGGAEGTVFLLKSTHDGHGHYAGSHENYEAEIGSGLPLFCWRVGVVLLLVTVYVCVTAFVLLLLPVFILWMIWERNPNVTGNRGLAWCAIVVIAPAVLLAELLVRLTAFHGVRRQLLPFLVSRTVLAGTGMVHPDGRFTLSPRAEAIRSVFSTAAEVTRGIFYFGHIWKGVFGPGLGEAASCQRLFRPRQRLQLTIGDANMCQTAEYLKIGTTLLVLDAIEAGFLKHAPHLHRPVHALRTISADPDLKATVRLSGGRRWTALQVQRYYLDACRRYVEQTTPRNEEAATVLRLWTESLDALDHDPKRMVGKLDWVTKRHLLDTAGGGASVEARRKLDLKYHELSTDGYYTQLEAAGIAPTVVEPEEVLSAVGQPPTGTPAALRGRLIRDHAGTAQQMTAGWETVQLKEGEVPRVISLTEPA